MTNYREILRLRSLGVSLRDIAETLKCSKQTVITVCRKGAETGITWPLPDGMTNEELSMKFFPRKNQPDMSYEMPDCDWIHRELQKPNVTLNLLWYEYYDRCIAAGKQPYKLTQFKKHYRDYSVKHNLTMHLEHKPGDVMQVDWAGDTLSMMDVSTGEVVDLYLFVSTLPYSGYTYCEVFRDMALASWITAHVNALGYFGGVPHIIQCDNLKTGVIKHSDDEIVLNRTYSDLGEHYNVAILPGRIRKPKDKAHVEGAVKIAERWILAALRNRTFFTEAEANNAVREKLEELNRKPYQVKDGSRWDAFQEEKLFLSPLPQRPFEFAVWKKAKPGLNYHISVDKQNYSVPYEYAKREVDVRLTKSTVEVFYNGCRIASHARLYGRLGQYSTVEDHMPKEHRQYNAWSGERFRNWAKQIGESTFTVVDRILLRGAAEQQGYKSCMSLLKLTDKYPAERLEAACRKALRYGPRPTYKNVLEILKSGLEKDEVIEAPRKSYGFVRGAEYFGGGDTK